MRRLTLVGCLALLLAACGDCDCCKKTPATTEPPTKATAATAIAPPEIEPAAPTPPVVSVPWRGEGTTLELSVWHMRCAGCEKKVEDALKGLEGVKDAVASNADSKVVVTLADASSRETVKPLIRTTLKDLDFQILGE